MRQNPPNTIEQAQQFYHALTGRQTHLSASGAEVLSALDTETAPLLVELPWGERRGDELHARHEVLLTRFANGRIYFINALKTDLPVGSIIEGHEKGPTRRIEPAGEESLDLESFLTLFNAGGTAMIRG